MQYISKNALLKELSVLKFNKTEKLYNSITATTKNDDIDILKDKKLLETFLQDIQDIINETNYNEKNLVLQDLKDILLSLNAIKNKNSTTNIDKIVENINKTSDAIQQKLSKYGKSTDISKVLIKIANEPLNEKYINEVFKTINTKTLFLDKEKSVSINTYLNKVEKTHNINNSLINTNNYINTSITTYNKKTLNAFSKSFGLISSSIKSIKSITSFTSNLIFNTLNFIVSIFANVIKTGYIVGKFIVSNTISALETVGSLIFNFLLSKPGLLFLAFIGGFIYGKLKEKIKNYINNSLNGILDIKTHVLNEISQKTDDILKIIDEKANKLFSFDENGNLKTSYNSFMSLVSTITDEKKIILDCITYAVAISGMIASILPYVTKGYMFYKAAGGQTTAAFVRFFTGILTGQGLRSSYGGVNLMLTFMSAISAIQGIANIKEDEHKQLRELYDLTSSFFTIDDAAKAMARVSSLALYTSSKYNFEKQFDETSYTQYTSNLELISTILNDNMFKKRKVLSDTGTPLFSMSDLFASNKTITTSYGKSIELTQFGKSKESNLATITSLLNAYHDGDITIDHKTVKKLTQLQHTYRQAIEYEKSQSTQNNGTTIPLQNDISVIVPKITTKFIAPAVLSTDTNTNESNLIPFSDTSIIPQTNTPITLPTSNKTNESKQPTGMFSDLDFFTNKLFKSDNEAPKAKPTISEQDVTRVTESNSTKLLATASKYIGPLLASAMKYGKLMSNNIASNNAPSNAVIIRQPVPVDVSSSRDASVIPAIEV